MTSSNEPNGVARPSNGPAPRPEASPNRSETLDLVSQLRRWTHGRIGRLIVIATGLAVVGGILGYSATTPVFRSSGAVSMQPDALKMNIGKSIDGFLAAEMSRIKSHAFLSDAMALPVWSACPMAQSEIGPAAFGSWLSVSKDRRHGQVIYVSFEAPDPESAYAGLRAVIQTYTEQLARNAEEHKRRRLETQQQAEADLLAKQQALREQLASAGGGMGLSELEAARHRLRERIEQRQTVLAQAIELSRADGFEPTAPVDAADQIEQLRYQLLLDEVELKQLQTDYGRNHPEAQRLARSVAVQRDVLNRLAATHAEPIAPATAAAPGPTNEQVESLRELIRADEAAAQALYQRWMDCDALTKQIEANRERLAATASAIATLRAETASLEPVRVEDGGKLPGRPFNANRRAQHAVLGAAMGGGLGVAACLFFGLIDRRFRGYDDAALRYGSDRVLALLPAMGSGQTTADERLSASMGVHGVRAVLQSRRPNGPDSEGFCVMITSANPGAGKSSVALALGLSFAATGSRTLLVDFDFLGCALTDRLQSGDEPVAPSPSSRVDPVGQALPTQTPNLWLLPVQERGLASAGKINRQDVRRLLDRLRHEFEVVIIDTGPILGGLEAKVLSGEADEVVVVVPVGDRIDDTERAMKELTRQRARVAGIVLNRVGGRDLARHTGYSSLSTRFSSPAPARELERFDAPNATATPPTYGPLAQATAASLSRPNGTSVAEPNGTSHRRH